jgi:hypothetical protein
VETISSSENWQFFTKTFNYRATRGSFGVLYLAAKPGQLDQLTNNCRSDMSRILILLLSVVVLPLLTLAKPVDLKVAGMVAKNFLSSDRIPHKATGTGTWRIASQKTFSFQGQIMAFAFNFEPCGFVIISAEDAVPPVLAYSFDGRFPTDEIPVNFRTWMEGYYSQIIHIRKKGLPPGDKIKQQWSDLLAGTRKFLREDEENTDVLPLIHSNWDQVAPYNILCPPDPGGPGGNANAGCVAVAMTQIMYYYRWPVTGTGQHCYTPSGYPQQCADFGNTNYLWNQMLNNPEGEYNDSACATLIWHAGVSVNMIYGPGSSGAYTTDATNALISYFKYQPSLSLIYKANYSDLQWKQIMRENLDLHQPIYYSGHSTSSHAFIMDGYQGTDYFHFNWGWSGMYNGYYYLSNLNPGVFQFTEGQEAIVNIFPDTVAYDYPPVVSDQTILDALAGTFDDGSGPSIDYQNLANYSWLIQPYAPLDSITSITLKFDNFSTQSGFDLVKVYKGATTSAPLVATYSGSEIPPDLTVNHHEVLVTFETDATSTDEGWFITYHTNLAEWCDESHVLSGNLGYLSDGSGIFNYRNHSNCRWIVHSLSGDPLTLTFSKFKTEPGKDFLNIFDDFSGQPLGSYTGIFPDDNPPAPVTAASGSLYIVFFSNNSKTFDGWEGIYSVYPVGREDIKTDEEISVFPNPASDRFAIGSHSPKNSGFTYQLFDSHGRVRVFGNHDENIDRSLCIVDVSGLVAGIYLLRITKPESVTIRKVVVE